MADAQRVGADFVDAFNAHDERRIRDLNTVNAVLEAPGDVRVTGRDAAAEYGLAWLRAFPDAHITLHHVLEAGDWVVQEFSFEGTHDDTLPTPGGAIPATHRHFNGRGVQLLRVEGDRVADTRLYFDQVQVLTQLGVMPAAAHAHA